jgi:hypothetical protein
MTCTVTEGSTSDSDDSGPGTRWCNFSFVNIDHHMPGVEGVAVIVTPIGRMSLFTLEVPSHERVEIAG